MTSILLQYLRLNDSNLMPPRSTPKDLSKEERALLMFSLLNPMHKDACCLYLIISMLDQVFTKKWEEDPRQGPFLKAGMAFLTTERSDEGLAALRKHLSACHCKPRYRASHSSVIRFDVLLEKVLWFLSMKITEHFKLLGPAKFRKAKPNSPADVQPWPTCVEDVIPAPRTEHDILVSLLGWAAPYPGGHSVFALIGALGRFVEPFGVMLFQAPGVFLLATRHLKCALDAYDPRRPYAKQMTTFTSPVLACAQGLFHTVSLIEMAGTMEIMARIYEELYPVAVGLEPILRRIDDERLTIAKFWFATVRSMRDAIGTDGTLRAMPPGKRSMEPRLHYARLFQSMAECLEAAWAAPSLPHKALCKSIKALRAEAGLADDKAWSRAMHDSGRGAPADFVAVCSAHKVGTGITDAVWQEISQLVRAKVHFGVRHAAAKGRGPAEDDSDEEEEEQGSDGGASHEGGDDESPASEEVD
ncbi:hypothetical protein B0H15DRAFT_802016 [Mycena belliarum]|uniref:Uncharacterized protein n=1 Tax=Mycena belliarum TaxID=1033014 RepID=A0AAD6U5N8_9AGAR|nr:hypothetical protein B0H15DRAFT_802016 [Mycena belliae]